MGEIRTRLINTLFVYLENKIFFLEQNLIEQPMKVFGGFVISLGIVGGWLPLSFSVALTGLEILVAFLQAYVFAILIRNMCR